MPKKSSSRLELPLSKAIGIAITQEKASNGPAAHDATVSG